MDNSEIRAHVLKEFYDQEMRGEFQGIDLDQFATRLGVPRRHVEVAIKYLVDMGLLMGHYVLGTDVPLIMGITALGMDVIDNPKKFTDIEINMQNVQVSGPVFGPIGQAQGKSQIIQANTFDDLDRLIGSSDQLKRNERAELKAALAKLKQELDKDQMSRSRIAELMDMFQKYNWLYPSILDLVVKVFTKK